MSWLSPVDDGLADFLEVRPRLFGIACRMLSAAEAEDVVQDVWIRPSPGQGRSASSRHA
ncbi:MAG TPA: hypothetical protein VIL35_10735 [Vicinamibacterales bacterium]